jgi:cytochrome c oxidase subunit III
MRRPREALDVSELPTVVFGHRDLMWWGTTFFAVIEGFTLALMAATYIYLRKNFTTWPPERTPLPSLTLPTISLVVMLISLYPAWWTKQQARRLDLYAVREGLLASAGLGFIAFLLRFTEFFALNTRWDSNAYGSAAWLLIGLHISLHLLDIGDTIGLAVLSFTGPWEEKHFTNTSDNSNYWYFMVLCWVPLYILVFLSPRFI